MNKLDASINTPGRMTVLALLVAGLAQTGFAAAATTATTVNHLVISQVYGGGGNSGAPVLNDFIEIFNPTSAAINVNGWSVQYASKAGVSWGVTALGNKTIPAGGYLLVQEAAGAGAQAPIVGPDVPGGTLAMSGTDGKVALRASTVAFTVNVPVGAVDMVAYGASDPLEGAPTAALSNTKSAVRTNSCVDTDVNVNDFTVGNVVTPRNSSTPAAACGVVAPIALTCPASLLVPVGSAGSASLTAIGNSSTVSSAAITGGATAGISLANFSAASANGGTASVNLSVAASLGAGTYPIAVTFSNSAAESASCTVSVQVQAAAGSVTHSIAQIQGSGTAASPVKGQVVTTEGVVTFLNAAVYAIQSRTPNGDPTKSDGILVFNLPPAGLLVGDLVRVTGTVSDYQPDAQQHPYTEITAVTATATQSRGNVIAPTNVSYADIRSGNYDSMLVNILDTLTVQQTESLAGYGEVSLAVGRKEVPTSHYRPGTSQAVALRAANDANGLVLDDGLSTAPTSVPYLAADKTLRAGDSASGLTGILDFGSIGSGIYGPKLQPVVTPVFSRSNPRTDAPSLPVGNVKVASANVLNFFTVFTDGTDVSSAGGKGCTLGSASSASNCRGADNLAEFTRQRDKIVNELKGIDADVFGLMEIQNDGDVTVKYLVDQLNLAIGATTYAVVPKPADTGTDAIRVAMIYKPAKLTLVGGPLSDGNTVNNRPPFAQTFSVANGGKFSLIVNHMKSKGSCSTSAAAADKDSGDGQSCWNLTRVNQATRLTNFFIPQVVNNGGTPNVLVIGDLNSYGMEDPIKVITDSGMVNQLERFIRPNGMPYSFVFNNETGYLDHALASASLSPQVIGAAEWHNNADEPTAIDYNFDGKPGGASNGTQTDASKDTYVNNAYRASDHDPVIISLALAAPSVELTASFNIVRSGLVVNRITGKNTGTITFTNTSSAPISGPFQVEFDRLTLGITVDNPTGTHNGAPYITVSPGTIAPGASFTMPISLNNPGRLNIGYTTTIFSGNF